MRGRFRFKKGGFGKQKGIALSNRCFSRKCRITIKLCLLFFILGFWVIIGCGDIARVYGVAVVGGTVKGKRLQRISSSPQYDVSNGQFKNTLPTPIWIGPQTKNDEEFKPYASLPIKPMTKEMFMQKPSSGLRVFWLGHATVLLEIDGYRVLTDPMFSERASPLQWIGPKRFFPSPIAIEDLPHIDAVVISHDHYDHLDHKSIESLAKQKLQFFVPLGVGAHLEHWGVPSDQIVELDWWQNVRVGNLLLTATPARHFSGRNALGSNDTLWATWTIVGPHHRVFFGGDTGMSPDFAKIGEERGPFDITLIPIGAYNPDWPYIHLFPEEAVQAHLALRGNLLLPIHWGTFDLAPHSCKEPIDRLQSSAAGQILISSPLPGEAVEIDKRIVSRDK